MRKGTWTVLFVCVAFLLGMVLEPQPAFSQRSLFEEEKQKEGTETEEKPPAGGELKIPRTAEASRLATEALGKVAKSYFNLLSEGVTAFNATFTVEQGGESAGKIKVTWSKSEEEISIEPEEGKEETQAHEFVKALFDTQVFMALIAGPFEAASAPKSSIYGIKSGDKFVIDMTQHAKEEDSDIQAQILFVSADMSEVEGMRAMGGGEVWGRIYRGEEVEGKRFISSSTMTLQQGGEQAGKAEFTWTYTRKDGMPFIKRIRAQAEGGGEKLSCAIVLEKVTFQKGRKAAEPEEKTGSLFE
jgi:hypothetical protein